MSKCKICGNETNEIPLTAATPGFLEFLEQVRKEEEKKARLYALRDFYLLMFAVWGFVSLGVGIIIGFVLWA